MFQIEMRKAPGITEEERRRRLHQAYEILLSVARRKKNNTPAEVAELETGAPSADLGNRRQAHGTAELDLARVAKV